MIFPPLPEPHAIAMLGAVFVALVLFANGKIPIETSCLIIIAGLATGFTLFPHDALKISSIFAGFGNEALIAILALMVVGHSLETTGALRPVAMGLARMWEKSPVISLGITLFVAAILSAFLNNTPIVVMLLPILVGASLKSGNSPSGVLMPMGLATLLGGMSTTIGTSTNLLVVGVAEDMGMARIGMFDFALPAVMAGTVGVLYLWLIAPRILPERTPPLTDTSPRAFEAALKIKKGGFSDGATIRAILEKTSYMMKIVRIRRSEDLFVAKLPTFRLKAGDRIIVADRPENLKEYERLLDVTASEKDSADHGNGDQRIAEIVVTRGCPLDGHRLAAARLIERYNFSILALHRPGEEVYTDNKKLADTRLSVGDVLLAQGSPDRFNEMRRSGDYLLLDGVVDLPRTKKAIWAGLIMLAVVIATATGFSPISVSAMAGVAVAILTGCLSWREAASALSIPVIMVVAASLALGHAMTVTGGADYLASLYVAMAGSLSPEFALSGLILLIAILTNVVSNNAAAVIGVPIAVGVANQLGVAPEAFVLAVLFGANMSFATPMGYQTNLLVMTAGGYKFSDFLRAGLPLTIILWLLYSFLLPILYPL